MEGLSVAVKVGNRQERDFLVKESACLLPFIWLYFMRF